MQSAVEIKKRSPEIIFHNAIAYPFSIYSRFQVNELHQKLDPEPILILN
ncbi:MAG: hypothetical protein PUP90_17910 [Nostoc sp. S4]|nr:hypothetical protein [Nostoc sp. S4]